MSADWLIDQQNINYSFMPFYEAEMSNTVWLQLLKCEEFLIFLYTQSLVAAQRSTFVFKQTMQDDVPPICSDYLWAIDLCFCLSLLPSLSVSLVIVII